LIQKRTIKKNPLKPLILGLFLLLTTFCISQPYNNSWINYSQQYYKFKIAETGIYRIDSTTLVNAGIPLTSINPQNIQIFAKGVEIPIHIEGEIDGIFNTTDFIEFYGEHNDGWNEEQFYGSAINHPNPYYSLINDTINYYITWNSSTSNNRLIIETDTNFSSYTPITYFNKETIQFYNSTYFDGETNSFGGTAFGYASTEGWFDGYYSLNQTVTKSLSTKNVFLSGPNATLKTVVLGQSDFANVAPDHHLRLSIGSNVIDSIFEAYKKIDIQMSVPTSSLGGNTTSVVYQSINDLGSGVDRQTISYVTLNYPHTPDMEGLSTFDNFYINDHPTELKTYLNFTNFNAVATPLFYDLTTGRRIQVIQSGVNYKCLIPNTSSTKKCYISSVAQVKNITAISPINGNGTFTDYTALQTDTAFVIITHSSLMQEANNYANYRLNTLAGNNPQNAIVFDVDEMYDQFAYGIEKHPFAIRGFVEYIVDTWSSTPRYLFLLGKSIKAKDSRKNVIDFHNNLVPSFGNPASDNMLTSGLNGTDREPLVPTGRLAAKNGTEVTWYLDKITEHENPTPSNGTLVNDWMKRVLHFGGGTNPTESQSFMNALNSYKQTIEDTLFGGNVISFSKSSTAPIQINLSDSIKDYIESGVALMTFFGHASTTGGFDQNLDNPALWPNQNGKYPLLVGLACYAGDIHLASANSSSEEHVILANKGVIGFLSAVDLSISSTLNYYASNLYNNISYKNYKGSIGNHIKNTIISTQGSLFSDEAASSITFHGDPSLVLNGFDLPDYMIEAPTITFSPTIITSELDSFDVNILVSNLGRATNDTIILELVRDFPELNFSDTTYVKTFSGTKYQETITFTLPVDVVRGLGLNNFTITVDAINAVAESFENNNTVTKSLNIQSGEIIPIYPYNFMIVPDQGVTLSASTAFPFEPIKNYVFELDTTDYFNSPIKESTIINQVGGVLSWTPNLLQNMPDSTVYFWRVSKDSVNTNGYNWRLRSFQYIIGKEGWEQDHFFQFENDELQFINHDRLSRKFNFVNDVKQLKGITYGAADFSELNKISYYLDADLISKNGWLTTSAIHVAVLDSLTLKPWSADDKNLGQANVNGFNNFSTRHEFIFRYNNPSQMAGLETLLKDSVPSGNHILMWTWHYSSFPGYGTGMPPSLKLQLSNMGATQLPIIQDSLPFLLYHKKGNNLSTIEVIGDSINHKNLQLVTTLTTNANYANIFSSIVGPATRWDSLSWRMNPLEFPTSKDSSVLNVYGIDTTGNEVLLINSLPTDSGDIRITNTIDAAQFPYLKLNAFLSDDSLFTAPQLDRWHVIYAGVPEAALDPKINYTFQNDTVNEGQDITISIAIKNISRYDMDSLLISFAVLDKGNTIHYLPFPRQKPLLADSIIIATLTFSTNGYPGLNSLLIDVNPNNDQLEQYHFNNIAQIPFYVNSDNINPILDVTFDGVHILDGDIVSPKAEIVIELTDENPYLLLNDTSDYAVYIADPYGSEKRIFFIENGVERMQFIPASLPKNNSKIIFRGNFPIDGKYKLRVQASDRTDNNSGDIDYRIGFEVINKSTITNIINYPNPFTTSTRFVFTLTGSEIPDIFKIQIMTITGKVVREINKDELGIIRIGNNISDFAWDGTDTYGDRLANGLYLYRVITQINSDEIELRESSMDYYFKKGYGKMYLFR
jgi:hypothetical protein